MAERSTSRGGERRPGTRRRGRRLLQSAHRTAACSQNSERSACFWVRTSVLSSSAASREEKVLSLERSFVSCPFVRPLQPRPPPFQTISSPHPNVLPRSSPPSLASALELVSVSGRLTLDQPRSRPPPVVLRQRRLTRQGRSPSQVLRHPVSRRPREPLAGRNVPRLPLPGTPVPGRQEGRGARARRGRRSAVVPVALGKDEGRQRRLRRSLLAARDRLAEGTGRVWFRRRVDRERWA